MKFPPSAAMQRGIKFHEAADKFYDHVDLAVLSKLENWQDRFDYVRSFYSSSDDAFDKLAELEVDRYNISQEHFVPLGREMFIEVTNSVGRFRGYIDRLIEVDDKLMVEEFKRSRKSPDTIEDVKFELAFYAMLLKEKGFENVELASVFFAQSNRYEVFTVTDRILNNAYARVDKILNCIKEKMFEPVFDDRCSYCPVRDKCLEGGFDE
ncbi:MAG: PD-(D/E)XK nuclease family protein [Gammaproteobacteria bacterium]|nr:PD-(D/E)XK nuclease family protein [Gammaproteobacteria bacterium]